MDDEVIFKLKDNNKNYYALLKWNLHDNDYLKFTLTDCSNAWKSSFTKTCLERNSYFESDLKMLKDQLNKACKRPNNQFEIKIVLDKETNANIIVKKIAESQIKITLIKFELKIVDDPSLDVSLIIDKCINSMNSLEDSQEILEQNIKTLKYERDEAMKEYTKCVDAKIELEEELYTKFVVVLNEKKRKIKELREELDELILLENKINNKKEPRKMINSDDEPGDSLCFELPSNPKPIIKKRIQFESGDGDETPSKRTLSSTNNNTPKQNTDNKDSKNDTSRYQKSSLTKSIADIDDLIDKI